MFVEKYNFQGLNISVFTETDLNKFIEDTITSLSPSVGYGYSIGIIPKLKKVKGLLDCTNNFDLLVTDGRLFYLFAKLFGSPVKYDISIPNLVFKSLQFANNKNLSVFFWGGTGEANSAALNNVSAKYKSIKSVDGHNGYFTDDEKSAIIEKLLKNNYDFIFLTLTTPEKELLADELKKLGTGKFIIPCGGMIDVLAGNKKVSPRIIKKLGLAWLYRFIQEPGIRYQLILESFKAIIISTSYILRDILFKKNNNAFLFYINGKK